MTDVVHVPLTKITDLIKKGHTRKQIADQFGVSVASVDRARYLKKDLGFRRKKTASVAKIKKAMALANGHDRAEHTSADELARIGKSLVDTGMKLLELARVG